MSWQEVMRIAGTQIVVSTIAKRVDGNQVEVRQCTEPEKQPSFLRLVSQQEKFENLLAR